MSTLARHDIRRIHIGTRPFSFAEAIVTVNALQPAAVEARS